MRALLNLSAAGLCLSSLFQASGAVIEARSLSYTDVEHAVSSARNGDTVVVPAGKEDWKSTLNVTKAITLQFAGIGQSVILDDIIPQKPDGNPGWSQAVINFSTKPNNLYRLTGLEIDKGLVRTNRFLNGAVQITGSTTGFRIDHCRFVDLLNNGVYAFGSACGVIDHCDFHMRGALHAVAISHQLWAGKPFGDGSWETRPDGGHPTPCTWRIVFSPIRKASTILRWIPFRVHDGCFGTIRSLMPMWSHMAPKAPVGTAARASARSTSTNSMTT